MARREVYVRTESGTVYKTENPEHWKGATVITRAEGEAAQRAEAVAHLRELFPPGSVVPTVLRHVSASGMSRRISVLAVTQDAERGPRVCDVSYHVARAVGFKLHKDGGLVVGGCGMDMGFHVVYSLSSVLYGAGYECLGRGKDGRRCCPSNYHTNHRDTIQCEGVERDGEQIRCYRPSPFSRFEVPEDWPTIPVDRGEVGKADGVEVRTLAACLFESEKSRTQGGDGTTREVCPTCEGRGRLPNPDGPERFDLVHEDGYALRHEWV